MHAVIAILKTVTRTALLKHRHQIDVAVNATESGTIKEFLVAEEDTVTVGQDLVRIELGGEPSGDKKEAPKEEPKKSESESKPESKPEPKQESAPEPKKESAPAPSKPEPPKQPEKKESKSGSSASSGLSMGNREERRVSCSYSTGDFPGMLSNDINCLFRSR